MPKLLTLRPDELNAAVGMAHDICVQLGGCDYGEETIIRPAFRGEGTVQLRICVRCSVPERPPRSPLMAAEAVASLRGGRAPKATAQAARKARRLAKAAKAAAG